MHQTDRSKTKAPATNAALIIGYQDFRELLHVDGPGRDLSPLEVRADGVYVPPLTELEEEVLPSEERRYRLRHPTGNLSVPLLTFPCTLQALEAFRDDRAPGAIDPFELVDLLDRKAWALAGGESEKDKEHTRAIAKAKANGSAQDSEMAKETAPQYPWPIIAFLYGLRAMVKRDYAAADSDAKKVALSGVLDYLNAMPSDHGETSRPGKWPWGDYETELLGHLAAAVEHFWVRYDPTDPSSAKTSGTIMTWLRERGVSDRTAEVMAQIIRADGLRTGPR